MTKPEITDEIRQNMGKVLETLRQIVDKDGDFEFTDLKATGLSRVEVQQAISFINKEAGIEVIYQRRTRLFGGCTVYQWTWSEVHTNRQKLQHELSK